jgi:hypothetical protein
MIFAFVIVCSGMPIECNLTHNLIWNFLEEEESAVKTPKSNPGCCWIMFLILVPVLLWALSSTDVATADYASSAHGNSSYGVDRSGHIECPPGTLCRKGDCTHCHDTFDPTICGVNDITLFAVNDNDFCLKCHENTTNYATAAIVNRSYSYRAGGYATDPLDDIREAFSSTSSHNLGDIKTFINGEWGYTATSNPCTACHNQHLARGDPANAPNDPKSVGARGWPISLPTDHSSGIWELWGDDPSERMNTYSGSDYQAPYRYDSTSAYEPDGSATTNGSNLTDFNTFCTDCHNTTYTIYSTSLGRDLRQIDWDSEKHGKGDADGALDEMRNPYDAVMGKVLSCMDCHEAHGASNVYLVRDEVNGEELDGAITSFTPFCGLPGTDGNQELGWLCRRCHKDDSDYGGVVNQWKFVHHYTNYTPDAPYVRTRCYKCHWTASAEPISCRCCHYHGSQTTDFGEDYPCYADPYVCAGREPYDRRTF